MIAIKINCFGKPYIQNYIKDNSLYSFVQKLNSRNSSLHHVFSFSYSGISWDSLGIPCYYEKISWACGSKEVNDGDANW